MPLAQVVRYPVLKALLQRLVVEAVADLVLHVVEGPVPGRDAFLDAQEVETRARAYGLAHFAFLEREDRILELALHLSTRERAEVLSFVGSRRVGVLLHQVRKVGAAARL